MNWSYGRINRLYKNKEVRKDYKTAGDEVLKQYGLSAHYKDQYIFIQFVSRLLHEKDIYEWLIDKELNPTLSDEARERVKKQKDWGYEACFGLELEEIPKRVFKGIHLGQWIITDDGTSIPDDHYNISKKEYLRGMEIIEEYMKAIMVEPAA